jgi:Ca-activated chloride channel homolog
MKTLRTLALLTLAAIALLAAGCAAPMDASKSYSRGMINQGEIVPAENVRVAEYLNYYEQRFPAPVNEPLGLDLRLGNPQIPTAGGEVWLQIGLQARAAEPTERTPLNLALVIDRSGSMDTPDKMPYLKQSLRTFLQSLEPNDIVAIVAYDSEAEVILPAQPVGDGRWIQHTIDRIRPGGSTDLHGGMMLGFQEVDRNFDIRRNNRVLLLTDGIANAGVTNSDQIAQDALAYNQQGIYLSTIGLGRDFNDSLLSTLARQGKGAYHFIDSAQEMDKVFRQEVEGLVEKVAGDVTVAVQPLNGAALLEITGLEGTPPAAGAQVKLHDMGAGDSQVLLVRLQAPNGAAGQRPLADVTLSYNDLFAQRPRSATGQATATALDLPGYDPLADVEVLRNVTIKRSAEAMQTISHLVRGGRYQEAWLLARDTELQLRTVAALTADEQMVQDADLFRRYQVTLGEYAPVEPVLTQPVQDTSTQPQRWGPSPQVTPTLPAVEVR